MAQRAQNETADDVDDEDQHAGDGIALHELGGAIHRSVEIRLGRDLFPASLGSLRRKQAGVQIAVNRLLLTGQGVEREAGGHFRHAARALGDDHQVEVRLEEHTFELNSLMSISKAVFSLKKKK